MVYAGTYAEFVLPALIVLGFLTRIAAAGMIVFVAVQTYVDLNFHGVDAATIGAWFDKEPGSTIADQRAFWVFLLLYLVLRGAGAISLDRLFGGRPDEPDDDYEDF
jgi:putative oxidoreductase